MASHYIKNPLQTLYRNVGIIFVMHSQFFFLLFQTQHQKRKKHTSPSFDREPEPSLQRQKTVALQKFVRRVQLASLFHNQVTLEQRGHLEVSNNGHGSRFKHSFELACSCFTHDWRP